MSILRCNRDALVSALLNLVNNAIQAVGSEAQIHIHFHQFTVEQRPWLSIEVIDHGPGIDADVLPNLGDLFVTTKAQGTGLGIAVVKAVAKAHGGRFQLQSKPGCGVKATLLLPCDEETKLTDLNDLGENNE